MPDFSGLFNKSHSRTSKICPVCLVFGNRIDFFPNLSDYCRICEILGKKNLQNLSLGLPGLFAALWVALAVNVEVF